MSNLINLTTLLLLFTSFTSIPKTTAPAIKAKTELIAGHERREDAEYVPWLTDRKLIWEDFLCAPKKNTDAVASTSTALGIAYQIKNGELSYQITCNFAKQRSWGSLKTEYILAHEQGHFDITEIYARKLNQMLQDYQLNRSTFQKDINAIYEKVVKGKEDMQQVYDGQTDHSRNKAKQQEWLNRIEQLLADSEPYADYP